MIAIDDKLISDEVFSMQFACNLNACKGACCWEGDYGAPLDKDELPILDAIYDKVKPYLLPESIALIEKDGKHVYFDEAETDATPLLPNGACAYLMYQPNGVAKCGIQQAYEDGMVSYEKPISCHLYPIRLTNYPTFVALNYDEWDICSAACSLGKKLELPLFRFVKTALIRRFGEDFYTELDAVFEDNFNYKK